MRFIGCLSMVSAAFLLAPIHAGAQGFFGPLPVVSELSVIGPDGTYYVLAPASNSTFQNPSTDLEAFALTGTSSNKPSWSAPLTGRVGQVLPGVNNVYVVETTTSGSGRNTTSTTTVVPISAGASGGTAGTAIAPAGNITDIEVKTIGGTDYLYITTVSSSSTSSGGTTTFTSTRTLTVYKGTTLYQTDTL